MARRDRLRVLVVEDDPDDLDVIKGALTRAWPDVEIGIARDGEEFLARLREARSRTLGELPNLILLDLGLPVLDGRDALEAVKHEPAFQGIPIVVLSVSGSRADIDRSYASGAAGYITKPAVTADLAQRVSDLAEYWLGTVRLPAMRGTG